MKKILLTVIAGIIAISSAGAEDWKITGFIGASYSETAVSDNWAGGEVDVRNWMIRGEGSAEKDLEKTNWLNTSKLEFGKASLGDAPEQENADLIDIDSVYSYKMNDYVNPYLAVTADSQFTELFDPAVYGESAGIGWLIISRQDQNLKTRTGLAFRQTAASDIDTVSNTGAEWITNYDLLLNEYAKFVSELKMFSAFDASVDTRWDSSLYVKLGKYLTAQVGYLLVNPGVPGMDFEDTVQTRLTFGLGFSYNIF
ncbi:DUF481 domain-containing protein [Elusimicrobiota bacterium]